MNPTEFSLFALDAYNRPDKLDDELAIPLGAEIILSTGGPAFSAVAYRVGTEVLIAYRGTDLPTHDIPGWLISLGLIPDQLLEALDFYNDVVALGSTSSR